MTPQILLWLAGPVIKSLDVKIKRKAEESILTVLRL
jgi:hypothetical protein